MHDRSPSLGLHDLSCASKLDKSDFDLGVTLSVS